LRRLIFLFWPTLLVLFLDQMTKMWIRTSMTLGESIPVLGKDFFRLTHVENTGVAFGLQAGGVLFLSLFNAIASVGLIYLLLRSSREATTESPRIVQFALALILGGAIGNLIDRAAFGRVTDFFDFDFPDFIMTRWPVFNIADSAVLIGVTLWCLYLVFVPRSAPRENATQA
jgi:signal peptidase II